MEVMHSDSLDDSLTSIQWLCQLESKKILEDGTIAADGSNNEILAQAGTQQQQHRKQQDNLDKNPYPKPHYSYATLIVFAINSSREKRMTLQEIYAWIEENYPFYKFAKKGWKNSIRHNLSLHKFFVKEKRPSVLHGKGSYWRISPEGKENLMRDLMKQSQNLRPPAALLPHDPNRKLRPIMPKPNSELKSSKVHYVPFLACNLPIVFVPSTSMSVPESCAEPDTRGTRVFSSAETQTGVGSFVQAKAGSSRRPKPSNVSCESSTSPVMSQAHPVVSHGDPTMSPGDSGASRGWTLKRENASHGTTTFCHAHTRTSSASSTGPIVSPVDPKVFRGDPTITRGDPTLSRGKMLKRKSSTNAHHGQGQTGSPSWNVKRRNGDNQVSSSRRTATQKQLPNILRRKRKTQAGSPVAKVCTPPKSTVQSTLAAINSTVQVAANSPKFGYDDVINSLAELTSSPLRQNAFDFLPNGFGSPGFSPLCSPLRFGGHAGFTPPTGFTPLKQEADSGIIVTPVKGFGDLSFNWTPFKTGLTPLIQSPPKNELANCSGSLGCRKSLGLDKVNEIGDECGGTSSNW